MKLNEVMNRYRPQNGQKATDELHIEVEDPNTGDLQELPILRHFAYDSGDVGFGVGAGKSPYPSEWTFDYAEAGDNFTFMGKDYRANTIIELDAFIPYMDDRAAKAIYDAPDDAGDQDEGY